MESSMETMEFPLEEIEIGNEDLIFSACESLACEPVTVVVIEDTKNDTECEDLQKKEELLPCNFCFH